MKMNKTIFCNRNIKPLHPSHVPKHEQSSTVAQCLDTGSKEQLTHDSRPVDCHYIPLPAALTLTPLSEVPAGGRGADSVQQGAAEPHITDPRVQPPGAVSGEFDAPSAAQAALCLGGGECGQEETEGEVKVDSIGLARFTLHRRARSRTLTAEAQEEERRAGEKGINVNRYIGRRIPAEPDTLHHNPAPKCELLQGQALLFLPI
ncbi:hypothetical protein NQZ68_021131 [Dissostichus eleginoides]|nr:hypothetical protein NQZ68_021131 [Dissostichus eleginoides]